MQSKGQRYHSVEEHRSVNSLFFNGCTFGFDVCVLDWTSQIVTKYTGSDGAPTSAKDNGSDFDCMDAEVM